MMMLFAGEGWGEGMEKSVLRQGARDLRKNNTDAEKHLAKKLGIKLHFLPAYSPNLNPIERLWKVMNEHTRDNQFFKTAKEFKDAIRLFFEQTLQGIGSSLNSRINDNFQFLETQHSEVYWVYTQDL